MKQSSQHYCKAELDNGGRETHRFYYAFEKPIAKVTSLD